MGVWNVILCIQMLLVMPTCAGYVVCSSLRLPKSIAACYLSGTFIEWAMIQLFSVPMTLLQCGFIPLTWMISVGMGLLCLFGIMGFLKDRGANKGRNTQPPMKGWKMEEVFALTALLAGYLFLAYSCARYAHVDIDDARFVVTAVDIEGTNRLYLTDFGTGNSIDYFSGTLRHDLFSPWAVYIAYIARMTATHVTIIAHSVLPQSLMLCGLSAWLLLADRCFHKSRFEKYSVALIAVCVIVFGNFRAYSAESFFLRRIWQGKAVVASVGIPAMYLVLTPHRNKLEGWRPCLPIYIVSMAMCLFSAMGIIICSMMCGAFGLAYGIQRRKIAVALKIWIGALICFIYVAVMFFLMT